MAIFIFRNPLQTANSKSRWRLGFAAVLLLCLCAQAAAWSVPSHRIIGSLAEPRLSKAAAQQVKQLLRDEPEPSLAGVSTWADVVRDSDPEIGRRTATWHYVNFPVGACAYDAARDCPKGKCIIAALQAQLAILQNKKSPSRARSEALKWVVHLVGDLHQPLHTGYGFDRGGNDFQINWLGEGNNLHWVWDRMLISTRGITEYQHIALLKKRKLPNDPLAKSRDPAVDFALESCRLLRAVPIYPKSRKLKLAYVDTFLPVAEQQLLRASERLARLLNQALR